MNVRTQSDVFVIVPAYNESRRIGSVVTQLLAAGYRVVAVDDGSTDDTWEKLARPGVARLRHPLNRGQGAALQTGITYALLQGARVIVTCDGDGQHSVGDVAALVAAVRAGDCDIALGSRFLGKQSAVPWPRRMVLRLGVVFTGLVSGIWLTDTHNGLRALTRAAAEAIEISLDGMAHASEILDQVARLGLRYREIPVTVTYSPETLAKGQSSSNAVQIAFRFLAHVVTR